MYILKIGTMSGADMVGRDYCLDLNFKFKSAADNYGRNRKRILNLRDPQCSGKFVSMPIFSGANPMTGAHPVVHVLY